MNELAELIQQKKEIEQKIRELKNGTSVVGQVKIDVQHYPTNKPSRYFLAVYYKPLDSENSKWQTIYSSNDRMDVIKVIPRVINNLQELYELNKEVVESEEVQTDSI